MSRNCLEIRVLVLYLQRVVPLHALLKLCKDKSLMQFMNLKNVTVKHRLGLFDKLLLFILNHGSEV